MLRAWLNDKPKGRRAPVKVNGHHLNLLIAPAVNTKSSQKPARMRGARA